MKETNINKLHQSGPFVRLLLLYCLFIIKPFLTLSSATGLGDADVDWASAGVKVSHHTHLHSSTLLCEVVGRLLKGHLNKSYV